MKRHHDRSKINKKTNKQTNQKKNENWKRETKKRTNMEWVRESSPFMLWGKWSGQIQTHHKHKYKCEEKKIEQKNNKTKTMSSGTRSVTNKNIVKIKLQKFWRGSCDLKPKTPKRILYESNFGKMWPNKKSIPGLR